MHRSAYIYQMNPDCYSDVKLAERFFFENNIYLLDMFEKKVDSFTSNKTRQGRERARNDLMHQSNILNIDNRSEDPIRDLSRDLTKPIWNCVTKTDPVVVSLENSHKMEGQPLVAAINDLFGRFLLKMKHEHEDESNFRMSLLQIDGSSCRQDFEHRDGDERYWPRLQDLMIALGRVREKYERDLRDRSEQNQFMEAYLLWAKLMFQQATVEQGRKLTRQQASLPAELYHFVSAACRHMEDVIESAQGPTVINWWPNVRYLPDLVHPMLMPIYVVVRAQLMDDRRRQGSSSASLHSSHNNIEQESGSVFEEMPQRNFSKVSFINFDGYDSPFNLTIAKSLSKYLQYISFPCDEGEALQQEAYSHYFNNYSEFLVKHYVLSQLTEQEKALQHRLFKTRSRSDRQLAEYYKQLLVFPVYSRHLSQKYDMRSVQFYQSKFIKFIMKELVYIHIKEFNPSLIVVSMSHRLHLETPFFEELIKELTIIGNMRIIFYNNFTRNYMFQSPLPARYSPVQQAYECHRLYAQKFDRRIALIRDNQVNLSVLHRTAMFLKIASGTYTLQRTLQQDDVSEKYDIFRVQKYAGTLIKLIGKGHPVLERFKNRCNEYLRLQRMLSSIYESDKLVEDAHNSLPIFHKKLLEFTYEMIQGIVKGQATAHSFLKRVSREHVQAEWQDFALRFGLEVRRQRQEQDYKYITRLKRLGQEESAKGEFIALEFQIVNNGVSHLVAISKNSQICMEYNRKAGDPLVYLFNHLLDQRSSQLKSYCGEIDAVLQQSFERKVVLTEIELPWQPQHHFQSLTKFNYLQTASVVLLFWPSLYDHSLALASRFLHAQYNPAITNLIFAADRKAPHRFFQVTPANSSYADILPRCGCTCYQIPQTNLVYILGGFYSNREDYLNFQTDITVARIDKQFQVANVPKGFYFDYEQTNAQQSDLAFRMVRLRQDLVRPRIQFQVYQLQRGEDLQSTKVLLVGGVGQKFLRPYSMVGYMAHHLTFSKDGSLKAVRRIRLNNLVPANLRRPVRERVQVEANVVCGAQNRQIYVRKGGVPAGSAVFNWYHLAYDKQEKMSYAQGDNLAVITDNRQDRPQNNLVIRQSNTIVTAKAFLRHFSSLKEVDNKLALVYQYNSPVQQSGSVIFSLELQLAEEVYLRFVNLPSRQVPLTGSHLIAIDALALEVFAVLRHEEYTNGRCVLAYCDIAGSVQSLVQGNDRKIVLRQVYRFDGDMRHCTVKALPDRRVAVIHGFPMHEATRLPQCILKRTARGHYVREEVLNDFHTYSLNAFLKQPLYHSAPISFFFVARQAVVSWSFRSAARGTGEQEYHFLVEQLSCRQEAKRWRVKTQKTVRFQKMFVTSQEPSACVTAILDIRVTEKKHEILLTEGARIFLGSFDAHLQSSSNTVTFREYDRAIQQYEIQKFRHKFNVEYLQKLTKYPSRYEQAQQEMQAQRLQ